VHELRSRGVTIVFVSHAIGDIKAIGDRCMWLDHGRLRDIGPTDSVVEKYLAEMAEKDSAYVGQHTTEAPVLPNGHLAPPPESENRIPNIDHRHGDGRAEITGIRIYDEYGRELRLLSQSIRIIVRVSIRALADVRLPNVGITMRNHLGIDFYATNTAREGHQLPSMRAGDRVTVDFHIDLPELYPADFSFSPAIADGTLQSYTMCDWIDNAITLQMSPGDAPVYGYLHLPCRIEVNGRLPQPDREAEHKLA
jgi:lipopolysaccharide transport system ATP-binding protein